MQPQAGPGSRLVLSFTPPPTQNDQNVAASNREEEKKGFLYDTDEGNKRRARAG